MKKLIKVLKDERGQTLSEYGLLIALVAVASLVVLGLLGKNITSKFREVSEEIENAKPQ